MKGPPVELWHYHPRSEGDDGSELGSNLRPAWKPRSVNSPSTHVSSQHRTVLSKLFPATKPLSAFASAGADTGALMPRLGFSSTTGDSNTMWDVPPGGICTRNDEPSSPRVLRMLFDVPAWGIVSIMARNAGFAPVLVASRSAVR